MNISISIFRFSYFLFAAALVQFLPTKALRAEEVALQDPSFDNRALSAGVWSNDIRPWQETGGPNNGNGFVERISGFSRDGLNHLGLNLHHSVWQDPAKVFLPETRYTLTVATGHRPGATQGGNESQYFIAATDGTVYASGAFNASTLASGTFADAPPLVFDTRLAPSAVGKPLRVLLQAGGSGRSHFDRIRLTAESLAAPDGLAVGQLLASNPTPRTATLTGAILDSAAGAATVTLFWGPTDGGMNASAWAFSSTLAGTWAGSFSLSIDGLEPGNAYHFTARASNQAGTAWATPSGSWESPPTAPSVSTLAAVAITATGATARAAVIGNGGEDPVVTIFHGPSDGGTDPAAWLGMADLGVVAGEAGAPLTGLAPNSSYFFRAYGENSGGGAWAAQSLSFDTLIVTLPVVENRTPSGMTGTSATLRGRVSDAGNDPAVVTLCYGTTDGDTDPSAWQHAVSTPPIDGDFSRFVTGLQPATTYYFRYRAQNAAGHVWTEASGTFQTTALAASSVVINEFHYNPAGNASLEEFIELYNPGDSAVDLSGWTLSDAISFTFPVNTSLPPGGYLVVGEDPPTLLSRYQVTALGPWSGKLSSRGERIDLHNASGTRIDRVSYGAGFPWPTAANGGGSSAELIHPSLDNDLSGSWRASGVLANMDLALTNDVNSSGQPTPGRANSVAAAIDSIPPQIRQVAHSPESPTSNKPVTITARITDPDGMGPVSLMYQLVNPGSYIRLSDEAYAASWTVMPMNDSGQNGDSMAGDSIYTAVLPASLQVHRRLIRYRIRMEDSLGNTLTVPYADDEQPNFAYFVYDGLPAWTGALRPTAFGGFPATPAQTYPAELLGSLPPFHLIADATDVSNSQYNSSFRNTRFSGTVVERGKVFDHIQFRVRGIGSTYQAGKNKWNIYFNRSRDYQGHDPYGRPYKETWNNLLINANASPWASVHRGSAGIEEASSHRLFQLAGMAAMHTQYLHLRVIDDPAEVSATSQYEGDFWGLYLGLEPTEGNFLAERGLPDGNLYSIEGNAGDKKHQGPPPATVDSSDWNSFRNGLAQTGQTEQWYRDNVDLPSLYTFLAINRLIGNVDVRPGDNYRFYLRPTDKRWIIIPYDLDMVYIAAHHWGGSMDGVVVAGAPNVIRAISRHPALALEYRNRCREILSLIASDGTPGGAQIGQLLDEFSAIVAPQGTTLNWANLDAAMWNLHPRTPGGGGNSGQSSHRGNFFRSNYLDGGRGGLGGTAATGSWIRTLDDPGNTGFSNHAGIVSWMVSYATQTWPGGTWNRKAMTGIGTGADSDPFRQRGYGYQYLQFESRHGGWINGNANPVDTPDTNEPSKPDLFAIGDSGFAVDQLRFQSSGFSDPQGPGTYAAHQWRLAEIQGPGIADWQAGTPRRYEIEATWESPELTTAPGEFRIPAGVANPGKTYRVRVRHKDTSGRWSLWSEPIQFTASEPAPATLIHYWNFNPSNTFLDPTHTVGGGIFQPSTIAPSEVIRHTSADLGFQAANARNGDPAGAHLRVNLPLHASLTFRIPTTGYEDVMLRYETRRSGQGAGLQEISYSVDGEAFLPFASRTILDDSPVIESLDFRETPGVAGNPNFALRITFAQGSGGTAGNHRFDNLTVEARATGGGEPRFLPGGNSPWNNPSNWDHASIPNGPGAIAIIHPPMANNRAITIDPPVTAGILRFEQHSTPFRNRLTGTGLTLDGGDSPARMEVTGDSTGWVEFELGGAVTLASSVLLRVENILGDPIHGALRLRGEWNGPGGIIKTGPGVASLTGAAKSFTGPIEIQRGVLQITQPAAPHLASSLHVSPGGQLRLISASETPGVPRIHSFGGVLTLAGLGRGDEIPTGAEFGILGALRYDPASQDNAASITSPIHLAELADIHIDGTRNRLILAGPLSGTAHLFKTGGGLLALTADSPSPCPPVTVETGTLSIEASHPAPILLGPNTILTGSGRVASIGGSGTVEVLNETLRAASSSVAHIAARLSTAGSMAGNGCLELDSANALPIAPISLDLFLDHPAPTTGDRFPGGIAVPTTHPLATSLASTSARIFVPDPTGEITFYGKTWRSTHPADRLSWHIADNYGIRTVEVLRSGEPDRFAQWRNLFFDDAAERAEDSISGPFASPSGDGIANLLRYAHGVPPGHPVQHLLPRIHPGSPPQFRFRHDPNRSDIAWLVTHSPNLVGWTEVLFDSRTDPPPPDSGDGWVAIPLPVGENQRFFRLELLPHPEK